MGDNNYEEQECEIEAIKCIFMEDFQLIEEKPYKFEVLLKANSESVEKNHLSLKLTFELPDDYPNNVPSVRLKNLSPDIINNNLVLEFEKLIMKKAEESIGTMMLYEVIEALREQIINMNEIILKKLRELNDTHSIDNALKSVKISQDAPMSFTPVNLETFAKWCDMYKERMRKMKEEALTEKDLKQTGRQLFEQRKNIIEDIKLEDEPDEEDDEEFKDEEDGGVDQSPADGEEGTQFYDKALYEVEFDEDVDFE